MVAFFLISFISGLAWTYLPKLTRLPTLPSTIHNDRVFYIVYPPQVTFVKREYYLLG